jgi:hypothetical protein
MGSDTHFDISPPTPRAAKADYRWARVERKRPKLVSARGRAGRGGGLIQSVGPLVCSLHIGEHPLSHIHTHMQDSTAQNT